MHFVWDNVTVLPAGQRNSKTCGCHQPNAVALGLFPQSGNQSGL